MTLLHPRPFPPSASIPSEPLIPGFFAGGFECSSHRLGNGRRLCLAESTRHIEFADADYARLATAGIRVARDGLSWPAIEPRPGRRDFAAVLRCVRAARRHGVRVIWDLLHFGWPDDLDVFTPAFVDRFASLARDFAMLLSDESEAVPWICPVNEISFLAWAGGDVAFFNPHVHGRGFELKCQLVRASIAAIDAVRDVEPATRIVIHDPAFHVVAAPDRPEDEEAAEASRLLQFQGCDLLTGRIWPQLGGAPECLDVLGINFYPWNQWAFGNALHPGHPIRYGEPGFRPLHRILVEWQARYERPAYVGETGCEGDDRARWLRTACDEVAIARALGADIQGICLYPIVDFPGWDDDRTCRNGLWGDADASGARPVFEPMHDELQRQQRRFAIEPEANDARDATDHSG